MMRACKELVLPDATLHAGRPELRPAHQHVEPQVTWRIGLNKASQVLPRAWLVPSWQPHAVAASTRSCSVVLQLAPALIELTAQDLLGTTSVELVGGSVRDVGLRRLGAHISAELELGWRDTLLLDCLTHVVAGLLVRRHARSIAVNSEPRPAHLSPGQFSRLQALIHERIEQPPSVRELAASVGVTPIRLRTALKASTGLGPHGYIMRQRVDRARVLLHRSDQSLAEIALVLGFCSQSHFTAVFRRHMGCTPGSYRAAVTT